LPIADRRYFINVILREPLHLRHQFPPTTWEHTTNVENQVIKALVLFQAPNHLQ